MLVHVCVQARFRVCVRACARVQCERGRVRVGVCVWVCVCVRTRCVCVSMRVGVCFCVFMRARSSVLAYSRACVMRVHVCLCALFCRVLQRGVPRRNVQPFR